MATRTLERRLVRYSRSTYLCSGVPIIRNVRDRYHQEHDRYEDNSQCTHTTSPLIDEGYGEKFVAGTFDGGTRDSVLRGETLGSLRLPLKMRACLHRSALHRHRDAHERECPLNRSAPGRGPGAPRRTCRVDQCHCSRRLLWHGDHRDERLAP